jgi:hypothetical protein
MFNNIYYLFSYLIGYLRSTGTGESLNGTWYNNAYAAGE